MTDNIIQFPSKPKIESMKDEELIAIWEGWNGISKEGEDAYFELHRRGLSEHCTV